MAIRKKHFDCGHSGLGRFCHRCAAAKVLHRQPRPKSRDQFDPEVPTATCFTPADGGEKISLSALPTPGLTQKALSILAAIVDQRAPYTQYGGKRMYFDRSIISVPLGYHYRLLLRELDDCRKIPIKIMSHEAYNHYHG
ncbi:DUF7682 family zinc-binding protein [Acidithiobacillus sp.]|jgi:hypothetical protein